MRLRLIVGIPFGNIAKNDISTRWEPSHVYYTCIDNMACLPYWLKDCLQEPGTMPSVKWRPPSLFLSACIICRILHGLSRGSEGDRLPPPQHLGMEQLPTSRSIARSSSDDVRSLRATDGQSRTPRWSWRSVWRLRVEVGTNWLQRRSLAWA